MLCIFCLEEQGESLEHIFPDAIGGTLTTKRVCTSCNSKLGTSVDVLLTDHIGIMAKRKELGIVNRSGKLPRWDKLFGSATMANDPKQRVKIIEDPVTGSLTPQFIYKEDRTIKEDGTETLSVVIDASQADSIKTIIERELKRRGLPPMADAEVDELVRRAKSQPHTIEQPEVLHKVQVDIIDYYRAICKIAYELAWLWLGDRYLTDPAAKLLRGVVIDGNKEKALRGRAQLGIDCPPFDALWRDAPNSHIALLMPVGDRLAVGIRIFDVMCAIINVSDNRALYPDVGDGRFYTLDPLTGAVRDTGLPEEVHRICGLQRPLS